MIFRPVTSYFTNVLAKGLVFYIFASFFYLQGYTQNTKEEDKIAPAFRLLIEQNKITKTTAKKKCIFKRKSMEKSATKNAESEKVYDCIVYTKNSQVLRGKGIILNSILPTFVTAKATLLQILQMASMPEVTYVDAPSTNYIHTLPTHP